MQTRQGLQSDGRDHTAETLQLRAIGGYQVFQQWVLAQYLGRGWDTLG